MRELDYSPHLKIPTSTNPSSVSSSWIQVAKDAPYFVTDREKVWFPIGQNDSITWPQLAGIYARRDMDDVERYLRYLADHGVNCLRMMLEYCEGGNRYFENPAGHYDPQMVQAWDDIFALCEKYGLRVLLTPFDTFWTWVRWEYHPYNSVNGGPCSDRTQLLISAKTREFIKRRLAFVSERWGASGALFAWDLWNEIHPAFAADQPSHFAEFVEDVGTFLKDLEVKLHGRAHLQSVSVFGPLITEGFQPQTFSVFTPVLSYDPSIADCIYRHPLLDSAMAHFYEEGTIDDPKNTLDAATSVGKLVREALLQIKDNRPFIDSEYGPIHAFKDRHVTLPEAFDDEYFRHIQWAHVASGEASGGMRWPNRRPHQLTDGMRNAQAALARFVPLIDWAHLKRRNWNDELAIQSPRFRGTACGDDDQAVVWLLRTDSIGADGTLRRDATPIQSPVSLPEMRAGRYKVIPWNTLEGVAQSEVHINHPGGRFIFQTPPIVTDMAFAIRRFD